MTKKLFSTAILAGSYLASAASGRSVAAELNLGAELPAVSVLDQDGKTIDLRKEGVGGLTLVYFYPKADTPGCTKQACSLRDSYTALQERGVRIFGVSGDDSAAQKAFETKYRLPFRLLADTEKKVMDAFGVPHMGSFASRQAFLFKDGKMVWRDLTASTAEQAKDVLEALAKL